MSKSVRVEVSIQGTTPLLMNRFTEDAQEKASSGTRVSTVGAQGTPREQADPKVYRDKSGFTVLPGPNIFACLIQAGSFHKVGKSKVTTQKSSLIPAGISLTEVECPLRNNGESPGKTLWEVDSRPIVNPATGGRRLCHRPRFDEWHTKFTLEIDTTMFDPKFVRTLIDDAGKRVGLGDFRPARKGPFGKFVVTQWKET